MNKNKLVSKLINDNIETMARELGYDPSKIVSKTNNKTISTNGDCKEVEICRSAMHKVYNNHSKVYQVETLKLGKNGQVIREIKEVRGFLDKHPTNCAHTLVAKFFDLHPMFREIRSPFNIQHFRSLFDTLQD